MIVIILWTQSFKLWLNWSLCRFVDSISLNSLFVAVITIFLFAGLSAVVGNCDPGYYCPGGDTVPNPVATPCPIGLHCPEGTGVPVPCEPGTYTNLTQQASCLTCPAGFYCVPEEVIQGMASLGGAKPTWPNRRPVWHVPLASTASQRKLYKVWHH